VDRAFSEFMYSKDYCAPLVPGAFAPGPRPTLVRRFGPGWLNAGQPALGYLENYADAYAAANLMETL